MNISKFPSIEAYRHLVQKVRLSAQYAGRDENDDPIYDESKPLPTLSFTGTVKMHGSNGGIKIDMNSGEFIVQSRNNILTPGNDNAGFAKFVYEGVDIPALLATVPVDGDIVTIYGEWCGQGIQKGTALNQIDKMFVVFAAKVDDTWLTEDQLKQIAQPEARVFNVFEVGEIYYGTIDFENPQASIEFLEKMTNGVEKQCPVGANFGAEGIGEGIVWTCTTPGWESSKYWFKVKGEKHKVSNKKSNKVVEVDPVKMANVNEFLDNCVTEARLEQGVEELKSQNLSVERKNVGRFIQWVLADVLKEEGDTLEVSGLTKKDIGKDLSQRAREWFFALEDKQVFG